MAVLRPFKAVRPKREYAQRIAALPYDVMNSAEAREMAKDEPLSFLHVDRAEIDLPEECDPYSAEVYEKASSNLKALSDDGYMQRDEKACYYVYRLIMDGRSQTGLVGCAAIDDYITGVIKKHELTREEKEQDRIRHVDTLSANTGPIFLTYRKDDIINEVVESVVSGSEPEYDFTAPDGIVHQVWVIGDAGLISKIEEEMENIPCFYIADGHHRAASAVKVGLKRRQVHPDYTGNEEFNYFLCVVFPDEELRILDYNRAVKDLNGLGREEFLSKVSENFDIEKEDSAVRPKKTGEFGMYLSGQWYRLASKRSDRSKMGPVDSLDVSVLYNDLLSPVLGIGDPRTDDRIDFIGGIRGLSELERIVDGGWAVTFSMYPTQIGELMDIADAGLLMPPKSTWFEPKLRSGLFIHELEE